MAEIKKRSDYFKRTKLFEPFQPNPTEVIGKGTKGDCVIRALCAVLGLNWIEAFDILVESARKTYNVPNDKENYRLVLKQAGFEEYTCKAIQGEKRMTVEGLAKKYPDAKIFVKVANHATAIVNGKIMDSLNPANKCVYRYFKK